MVAVELYEDPRSDAARQLRKLRETNPKIDRQLRCMFARQIVGNVQKNYLRGQVLKRRSGDLAASISYRDVSHHETMVGSYGPVYARIHELGGTIVPRRKKWLRFQTENGWFMMKEVRIHKRPYLLPGITSYFDSGTADRDADVALQRELDKVAGK